MMNREKELGTMSSASASGRSVHPCDLGCPPQTREGGQRSQQGGGTLSRLVPRAPWPNLSGRGAHPSFGPAGRAPIFIAPPPTEENK
jgi:hypothetical protein